MKRLILATAAFASIASLAVSDHSIAEFPRLAGETDDAPRFQRAVDACCGGGVLTVPSGDYTLARTVSVTNLCSIEMSAGAYVKAVAEMDWMIKIDQMWQFSPKTAPKGVNAERYNLRYIGGTLDADGKASCLAIDNYRHFTLENATFLNGRRYGVGIETEGRGYEMIARNLYFKTLIHGLAGNTGLYTYGGDSHYTDIVVVDYTTGVHFAGHRLFRRDHPRLLCGYGRDRVLGERMGGADVRLLLLQQQGVRTEGHHDPAPGQWDIVVRRLLLPRQHA